MDEEYLTKAFNAMGEENVVSIKVIKNKFTGQVAGYGFVNFSNDQQALTAMHRLNGKIMPYSQPPTRFKLNHNSNRLLPGERNFSVWVGDLTPEIDDLQLYRFFSARFKTIVSAKVVLDETGTSKGFGFIRFGNEIEQQTALTSMQGISGLGGKPIKVSIAVQKNRDTQQQHQQPHHQPQSYGAVGAEAAAGYSADYYSQYSQYWTQVAAWQQYQQYYQAGYTQDGTAVDGSGAAPPLPPTAASGTAVAEISVGAPGSEVIKLDLEDPTAYLFEGNPAESVEHSQPLDYTKLNRKFISQSEDLYDSIDEAGWWYTLDPLDYAQEE